MNNDDDRLLLNNVVKSDVYQSLYQVDKVSQC